MQRAYYKMPRKSKQKSENKDIKDVRKVSYARSSAEDGGDEEMEDRGGDSEERESKGKGEQTANI